MNIVDIAEPLIVWLLLFAGVILFIQLKNTKW